MAMRVIRIILLSCLVALGYVSHAFASSKIGQLDFEQNLTDPYAALSTENPEGATYVSGRTGYAVRSSHNQVDAGGDFDDFHVYWTIPASGEYYVKAYIKYETGYDGFGSGCTTIQNVKWFWADAANGHWELIWQGETSLQYYPANGATWSGGLVETKYATVSITRNTWHKVEMYFKRSSGASNTNPDGATWVKLDDVEKFNETGMVTGSILTGRFPSIKATCQCDQGEGWWQLDDYEVWDGIPESSVGTISNITIGPGVSVR